MWKQHVTLCLLVGNSLWAFVHYLHIWLWNHDQLIKDSENLEIMSTSCFVSCDEMFSHQCISSEFLCTCRVCPQNKINEITSVLKPVLMVIKPRGCGRLDEFIDWSVEEAAAGGAHRCRRSGRDVIYVGVSVRQINCHTAVREGFMRIKNLNTGSNELLSRFDHV